MSTDLSLTQPTHLSAPTSSRSQNTRRDLLWGIFNWPLWLMLSWQDIRLRYRRSSIGPFWITISMAISIYTMGFLYGQLFKIDLKQYYPFLAAGMLSWNLISMLIIDGTNTFIEAESYLKQMKLPYTAFVMRVLCRCLIIFAHNILVIVPIMVF
ncbi:MAG: ABC transporter permease [Coxiellaceae bacterium]|nr:MAG: ABC transporter permease [Coxiellaceae bacterium]